MTLITDLLSRASNGTPPVPTTLASQKASGASSLSLNLATGWDTSTPVHFLLYEVDANTKLISGTVTLWKGVLSGTTVSNLTLRGGTDTTYPANSPVELAFTSAQLDDLITALQVSHNADGTMVSSLPLNTPVLTSPTTKGLVTGWVGANESWTYASATTINVPSDATTKYDVGDYLTLIQSATVKYFEVTSVTSTLLTVIGISGATVANSTISGNSYSKVRNPHGAGVGTLAAIDLFGLTGGYSSSPPVALTGQFYMQAGSATGVTNGAGNLTILFENTFPTGVLTILPVQGDTTIGNNAIEVQASTVNTAGFAILCGVPNTGIRVNYLAIGW